MNRWLYVWVLLCGALLTSCNSRDTEAGGMIEPEPPPQQVSFFVNLTEPHAASNAALKITVRIISREDEPVLIDTVCLSGYLNIRKPSYEAAGEIPYQVKFVQTNQIIRLLRDVEHVLELESTLIADHLEHYEGWKDAWNDHASGTWSLSLLYEPGKASPFGQPYRGSGRSVDEFHTSSVAKMDIELK